MQKAFLGFQDYIELDRDRENFNSGNCYGRRSTTGAETHSAKWYFKACNTYFYWNNQLWNNDFAAKSENCKGTTG